MMHDAFVHDDAAYVLGALAEDDRRAFRAHLATCAECTRRVAELTDLPALLSTISAADIQPDLRLVAGPVPDTLLPGLLRAVRQEQRRRRGLFATLGGIAAACVLALAAVLAWPSGHAGQGKAVAMTATSTSAVQATAELDRVGWGTQIRLVCHYQSAYAPATAYSLIVVDKAGVDHGAGSWTLAPGKVTRFIGGTALQRDQISEIEIVEGAVPILQLRL